MAEVFVLLGGNTGDRKEILRKASGHLEKRAGHITCKSSIYETEPWGFTSDTAFLNQAMCLHTLLSPREILTVILQIEKEMGRQRIGKSYASRPIDIDILFYEHLVNNEPDLVIPHPRLHLRKFSLIPLNEIAGSFIHPVLQKTIETLLKECKDTLKVVKYL
ncbi:MAG: 2-amino-4-hydroxy-6-hydroxymethyldihydropteridine diphosphokinase [Lentimicrobiaceae bacterium]|nr:2-amino-4-hydroxy-6-hydroxymethyldihydropteridine diphosphokinase [Lentimicrobiaceae bacterium]